MLLFLQQTLQAKVKNLERQKKTLLEKLEQNPIEQQNKLEKELNDISRQLRETTQKLVVSDSICWQCRIRVHVFIAREKERIVCVSVTQRGCCIDFQCRFSAFQYHFLLKGGGWGG